MLNLICGPSGSGKTKALIDMIRKDIQNEIRCFLLVPEQQAYISERDLPTFLPQNAGLFLEVVHFSGLAEDVFREYGGVTRVSLNSGTKNLIMWDTLRSMSPLLHRYGKGTVHDSTLASLMLQAVEELRTNGISGEILEETAKSLSPDSALQKKLMDISLIDAAYHARIEAVFGEDPSDRLTRLAFLLQKHSYFKNCHIYIDSFTSFTAQEYAVLHEIMKQADQVTVSLMLNEFLKPLPHFESIAETAKRLQKLASSVGCETQKIILEHANADRARSLQIIERDLWRFEVSKKDRTPIDKNDTSVRLQRCANLYEESEATALNILELIQGGMYYGDIAVIVRDTETYRGVLDAALERYNIPYFLSERTDFSSMPLARLILSALRAVSRHYCSQDIITMVKTGLAGVSLKEGAMFEEYCETWHISGNRFTDELWSMNPDGLTTEKSPRAAEILDAANRTRRILMEPLEKMAAQMRLSSRVTDRCRILYDYLCDLHISEQLYERAKTELETDHKREANETIRLYTFLTDMLTTLCTLFPDTELTVDEFISALTILFSGSDMGAVPSLHDCVTIGSAATVRIENAKAVLVLGLCEGEFPRAVSDDGLLNEEDKTMLEEFGILFDSRTHMRSSEELLFVYRAMTKPTERLFLSTLSNKTDGSELTPSLAFTRVAFLLDKSIESFDSEAIREYMGKNERSNNLTTVMQAPTLPNGTNLKLSQTKIQTFMLCPYRYYCTYHLKLRERKDSRPSFSDDGLFLHYVFEQFLKALPANEEDDTIISHEQIELLASEILKAYLNEVCPIPINRMEKQLLHIFERLRKLAVIMLKDILCELRNSRFIPSKFEQIIGMPGENGLPPIVIELKDGCRVTLSGMIDRIDLYEDGNSIYVRVVDYKSGTHLFKPEEVRSGLDIQLVLYLFAVIASDPEVLKPAGAAYLYAHTEKGATSVKRSGFLLDDPSISEAADQSANAVYTKKLEKISQDDIQVLMQDMRQAVKNAAERILSGEASKTPSEKACTFCSVRTHCDKAWHK